MAESIDRLEWYVTPAEGEDEPPDDAERGAAGEDGQPELEDEEGEQ